MADTITTSRELNIGLDYFTNEGKEKTIFIKVPNPIMNITESDIKIKMTNFLNADIVRSPEGSSFTPSAIGTAYTVDERNIDIDIES